MTRWWIDCPIWRIEMLLFNSTATISSFSSFSSFMNSISSFRGRGYFSSINTLCTCVYYPATFLWRVHHLTLIGQATETRLEQPIALFHWMLCLYLFFFVSCVGHWSEQSGKKPLSPNSQSFCIVSRIIIAFVEQLFHTKLSWLDPPNRAQIDRIRRSKSQIIWPRLETGHIWTRWSLDWLRGLSVTQ